jgi:putative copper export protein
MSLLKKLTGYLYLIVLSLWVGGLSLFTFVITPVIFKSYPRDVAADIVGKLFPSYFVFTLAVVVLALVFFVLSFRNKVSLWHGFVFGLIILTVIIALYANFRLYPEIKKVKQQVSSFETTSPDDPARVRFRGLHARSAILNLVMIADGLAVLVSSVGLKSWERR